MMTRGLVVNWIRHDLRDGLRRLARRPGFTLVAMGTLALGLSTSTAVFTYVNAYRQSVPGAAADNLFQMWFATEDAPWGPVSVPDFYDLRELDGAELSVTGVGSSFFLASVRHEQLAEVAEGEAVAGGFFSVLGIEMMLGRGISPEDDRPGATPVTVLSHDYWVSRYGADPDVTGRTILLNNEPYTIVGVVDPDFRGTSSASRPSFWLPLEQFLRVYRARSDTRVNREAGAVLPIVRLADGVSTIGAGDALRAFATGLDQEAPLVDRTRRFVLSPLTWISPAVREAEAATSEILVAAAGFLLLLACANVANLVLSSGARRHDELAVRGALGASRGRLFGQLLTESFLLSVPAGLAALALAGPMSGRLSSYFERPSVWGANVAREIVVDPQVMAFALLAAVVTGAASGLFPALRASARNPAEALGSRGVGAYKVAGTGRWLPDTRDLLVSVQVGICVVLLFVAALVLRTLESVRAIDPGFDTQQTLASYVSTSSMGVPVDERHRFYEELKRRFDELPWVEAATVAENAPLSGHPTARLAPQGGSEPISTTVARVWPGYFEVLQIEVARGRTFFPTDTVDATGVVVVNESLARRLSTDGDVVGQTIVYPGDDGEPDRSYEVVGVVRDASQETLLDAPGPVAYFSLPQQYSRPGNALLLSVRGDPSAAVDMMTRELRAVDTRLAIVNILTYRDVVRGALYTHTMNAELFTAIAVLGLLLSTAGVFAVLALAVAGRRREIGIRVAVGAGRMAVTQSVLGPIGRSVLVGLGVGLGGAFAATRLVESLLWGVAPADPLALGIGVGVLLTAVAGAVGVPLRRALEIDPVTSLRAD
jgi:putative ABC transport system permease protein